MKRFDRKFGADFLKGLPQTPAVYLFKDETGKVLYTGKAKNIRRRLRLPGRTLRPTRPRRAEQPPAKGTAPKRVAPARVPSRTRRVAENNTLLPGRRRQRAPCRALHTPARVPRGPTGGGAGRRRSPRSRGFLPRRRRAPAERPTRNRAIPTLRARCRAGQPLHPGPPRITVARQSLRPPASGPSRRGEVADPQSASRAVANSFAR